MGCIKSKQTKQQQLRDVSHIGPALGGATCRHSNGRRSRGNHIGGRVCAQCQLQRQPSSRSAWSESNDLVPHPRTGKLAKLRGKLGLPSWFSWRRHSATVVNGGGSGNTAHDEARVKVSSSRACLTMSSQDIVAVAAVAGAAGSNASSRPSQVPQQPKQQPPSLNVPQHRPGSPLVSPPRLLHFLNPNALAVGTRAPSRLPSHASIVSADGARAPSQHVWINATLWERAESGTTRARSEGGSPESAAPRSPLSGAPADRAAANGNGSNHMSPLQRYQQHQEATAVRFRGCSSSFADDDDAQSATRRQPAFAAVRLSYQLSLRGSSAHRDSDDSSDSDDSNYDSSDDSDDVSSDEDEYFLGGLDAYADGLDGDGVRGSCASEGAASRSPVILDTSACPFVPMAPSVLFSQSVFESGVSLSSPSAVDDALATPTLDGRPRHRAPSFAARVDEHVAKGPSPVLEFGEVRLVSSNDTTPTNSDHGGAVDGHNGGAL